jgi:hypothetical protein
VRLNEERPRPVLMIPLRRCGSHALRLRLNFSPCFYSPYPLHIVDFMPMVPRYGDLADDHAYFRLVVDVVGLHAASMVKWPGVVFDPVEIFDAVQEGPRSVHRVVWELLLRAGEQHHARVVMDKSLDSVHYAEDLLRLFPDLLFLNVVRDPRAQVASMTRAVIHDYDPLLNALTWVRAHDAALAVARAYPDRVLTIRYEDFLRDDEATLRSVCGFLGIDFLPAMLDVSRSSEARRIAGMSALWSSNALAPVPTNADKFRATLTTTDIETIETVTAGHMARYGYLPLTDASAPAGALDEEPARRRSDLARAAAWADLERDDFRDHTLRSHRAAYLAMVGGRLP